jgi:hypothetical protein
MAWLDFLELSLPRPLRNTTNATPDRNPLSRCVVFRTHHHFPSLRPRPHRITISHGCVRVRIASPFPTAVILSEAAQPRSRRIPVLAVVVAPAFVIALAFLSVIPNP